MDEIKNNFKSVFFRNYFNFKGRADRTEMWLFQAVLYMIFQVVYILMYPFIILGAFISAFNHSLSYNHISILNMFVVYGLFFIVMIPFIIPSIALAVRRLHDTNRSGWYLLLQFIPLIGGIIVLFLLAIDGDKGANQYGDDPKIQRYL